MAGDWIKDVAKQKRDNLRELACSASHLLPISIEHTSTILPCSES